MSTLFDYTDGALDEAVEKVYRAGLARDEREVVRLLDAHRQAFGDAEQIAYANRNSARSDDSELGLFPYASP